MLTVSTLALVANLVAAWFWFRSSRVEIRDNIDKFMDDLHDAGRLNARAAFAQMAAAGFAALAFLLQLRR